MPDKNTLKALIIGDVIGAPGCRAIFMGLPALIKSKKPDLVVVNGENAADGFGITEELAERIFAAGAQVITTGNHVWQKHESYRYLSNEPRVLRPLNYPPGCPGHGYMELTVQGVDILVANLQGRDNMAAIDCPFRAADDLLRKSKARIKLIDFHAESTREKEAFALDLDGKVSAIVGTHTHVPTADERILPKGTAYVTDLGATGPRNSVIGFRPDISVRRALTQLPIRNEVLDEPAVIRGVELDIDRTSGKALGIERVTSIQSL